MAVRNYSFFSSWSGGKDSCLALYRAIQAEGEPRILLTMLVEDEERSRSHGLPVSVIQQQSAALGIPLVVRRTSWSNYEEKFTRAISEFEESGIDTAVFGDIDLEAHRVWVERVCSSVNIRASLPLWQEPRRNLVEEFIRLGFKATIIAVKDGVLDRKFLGKELDETVVSELESLGVDAAGEEGEFHTVVTDGPIFSAPIKLELKEQVLRDGYWFQDVTVYDGKVEPT